MASLSVLVKDIPAEGLSLSAKVTGAEIGLEPSDAEVKGLLMVSAQMRQEDTSVRVFGSVDTTLVLDCVRCLARFEYPVHVPFSVKYEQVGTHTRNMGPASRYGTESEEDEESYPIVANRIHLAQMLREHVILAVPMQPLCHTTCLGLCPVCGVDLNEQTCACPVQDIPSPFAVLKERLRHNPTYGNHR